MTSNTPEVKDSPLKNLFWGILVLAGGASFLYFGLFDGSLGGLGLAIGACMVVGSSLLFWPGLKPKSILKIDADGIWTHVHQKNILWEDISTVNIESNLLFIEIQNVEKYFAEESKLTKAVLKRAFVELKYSDTDTLDIYNHIVARVSEKKELMSQL